MDIPAYNDDFAWYGIIAQYIEGKNKHSLWYNVEYHMWEYFKDCLKRKNRFFFQHPLLPLIEKEFTAHATTLPQGTMLYRARIDHNNKLWDEWNAYCSIEETPKMLRALEQRKLVGEEVCDLWEKHESFVNSDEALKIKTRVESGFQGYDASGSSAPPSGYARAGRCNPKGVSYLYAALEEHTAVAEIRPFIKDAISIAQLTPVCDLRLVNLDYDPTAVVSGKDFLYDHIRRDFARVNKSQDGDYLVTQFVAAFIEHLGYDGLCFRSSLVKDGTNYVLFNPGNCEAVSSKLCYLAEVNYVYAQCR